MITEEVKVSEYKFTKVLEGESCLVTMDSKVLAGELFRLTESGRMKRSLFVRAEECIPLERKRGWFKKPEYVTVVRFTLSGMIEIDGQEFPMTEPVTNEIYKNLDTDRNIDLKLVPHIVCTNNKNEIVAQFKFLSLIVNMDDDIKYLSVHVTKGNKSFTHVLGNNIHAD